MFGKLGNGMLVYGFLYIILGLGILGLFIFGWVEELGG